MVVVVVVVVVCSSSSSSSTSTSKSDTSEDVRNFTACNTTASSQCWPRCAPLGLQLLWGALEGLGWLSSLEGSSGGGLFRGRRARTCFRDKWAEVQKRRPTFSVPPCCPLWHGSTSHLGTVAKRTCLPAMGVGLRPRPSQLCLLLSCYRRGQAVLGLTANLFRGRTILTARRW